MSKNNNDKYDDNIYIPSVGKFINQTQEIKIVTDDVLENDDFKNSLLANLYSTVEFLKKELEEKNYIIRNLLTRAEVNKAMIVVDDIESTRIETSLSTSISTQTSLEAISERDISHDDSIHSSDNNTFINSNDGHDHSNLFSDIGLGEINNSNTINIATQTPINIQTDKNRNDYNQLYNIRLLKHKEFLSLNNLHDESLERSEEFHESIKPWPRNTLLIASDSIMNNIDESRLSRYMNVKVRPFSGSTVNDMFNYITPLLQKQPDYILLHLGSNDSINSTSDIIYNRLMNLKNYIQGILPNVVVMLSKPTMRIDNATANFTLRRLGDLLDRSGIKLLDNSNIEGKHIGQRGLHLNGRGTGRLAMNIISLIKKL